MSTPSVQVRSGFDHEEFQFVDKQTLSRLTGLSVHTFKSYRKDKWIQGVHWVKINKRTIRYNWPLIKDWLQNQGDPEAHQRAIVNYQAQLLSNQKRIAQRHAKYHKKAA